MRFVVTALAVALAAVLFAGCSHDKTLKESPEEIAKEQAAADAHNANTVPSAGDDESPSTDADVSGTTTTVLPEYQNLGKFRVGDCVDLPSATTATVRIIGCDHPHHEEVTAVTDVGASFINGAPTPEDWQRLTDSECKPAFDAYVRQPPPDGVVTASLEPTPETWYTGDHLLICTAAADREGNVLTGSVRKAG